MSAMHPLARIGAKGFIGIIVGMFGACLYVYVSSVQMLERRYP